MKHATLRQLKVFESVARLLSFSRAAEELHLTQPAVSTQIAKLEDHAGNALFEQFGKKIYLTAAGTELLAISHLHKDIMKKFSGREPIGQRCNVRNVAGVVTRMYLTDCDAERGGDPGQRQDQPQEQRARALVAGPSPKLPREPDQHQHRDSRQRDPAMQPP